MDTLVKKTIIILMLLTTAIAQEVKIGMSADFSGSISYLGNNMRIGIQTYFNSFNETSKIKYRLISYDDKYNPITASENVRKMIEKDKVVAFLGNLGTPNANVVVPILNEEKIVLFGAYTGGNVLRESFTNKYIFNYRVSYAQEAYFIVSNLLKQGLKADEIALFTQNDTYGDSGYIGAIKAFKDFGYTDPTKITHGRYTRNTLNIEIGLSKMLDSQKDLKAIVLVSVDEPVIKFIKYAKLDFPNVKFFALSPANIKEVSKKVKHHAKDLYVTQVVPLLSSKDIKIIKEYKKNLKKHFPKEEANLISLEGYIVGKLFVSCIKNLSFDKITSQGIYESLKRATNIDIGLDFVSSFKNYKHQYSSKLWLSTIKNGKLLEMDWNSVYK